MNLCAARFFLNAVATLAGFGIVAALLAAFAPQQEVPQVSAKLRSFEPCDTVFLGSSRVRRQCSPDVFDQQMRAAGHPMRSLNLGVDAMVAPELLKFSDAILQRKSIRYCIVDLNTLRRTISPDRDSPRELWWHDWKHTVLVLRDIATNPVPLSENGPGKLSLAASHIALMLQHYAHLGNGAELVSRAMFPDRQPKDNEAGNRGFHPERQSLPTSLAEIFETQLVAMKHGPQVQFTDTVMDEIYRKMSARCEQANVRIFFAMMPVISLKRPPLPPPDVLQRHTLLTFDDPAKFPELYRPEGRYDLQHFNAAGAAVFTETLARAVAADLNSRHGNN